MIRTAYLLAIVAVLTTVAVMHGMWTNRWNVGDSTPTNLFESVPEELGDWRFGELLTGSNPPPNTTSTAHRFHYPRRDRTAVVSIIAGYPGEVATHTPDVCYPGSGFQIKSEIRKEIISLPDHSTAELWTADFEKKTSTNSETIRVRWGWTNDGTWHAPEYPRWYFGLTSRSKLLYKVYIVHPLLEDDDLTKEDHYRTLIENLLPTLSQRVKQ